ncbi:hypothetical protein J1TS3_07100 [Siminovitchia fordii]|uniref:Uncharacterized protein n=1 Tax=Siminovitchia fordii TaxID=254759 RepID=A0ABQ4K1E0_9BACI|nr:hypothetical protein J1TS3_07100 [Siminovitchia fordii]
MLLRRKKLLSLKMSCREWLFLFVFNQVIGVLGIIGDPSEVKNMSGSSGIM